MTVAIHWESRPGLSHTLQVHRRGDKLTAQVESYEGSSDIPMRGIQGDLDTVLGLILARPSYEFSMGVLIRARYPLEDRHVFQILVCKMKARTNYGVPEIRSDRVIPSSVVGLRIDVDVDVVGVMS